MLQKIFTIKNSKIEMIVFKLMVICLAAQIWKNSLEYRIAPSDNDIVYSIQKLSMPAKYDKIFCKEVKTLHSVSSYLNKIR